MIENCEGFIAQGTVYFMLLTASFVSAVVSFSLGWLVFGRHKEEVPAKPVPIPGQFWNVRGLGRVKVQSIKGTGAYRNTVTLVGESEQGSYETQCEYDVFMASATPSDS